MIRKGNIVIVETQIKNLVTVGCDMGGELWATNLHYWTTGKESYYPYKGLNKKQRLYDKVEELVKDGYEVYVFYEAGRYGFAPARQLMDRGAKVIILPVNKLEILISGKKVKTDKIDAKFLSRLHPTDEISEVHIADFEDEEKRSLMRERKRIDKDIKRKNAQILAKVEQTDIVLSKTEYRASFDWHKEKECWRKEKLIGTVISGTAVNAITNMINELKLLETNAKKWEVYLSEFEKKERKKAQKRNMPYLIDQLMAFGGNGPVIARTLGWELGSFERFKNGKKLASYFGLTPTRFSSGKMNKEQGISKKGNKTLRSIAITMAWEWYHHQKDCELVKKWMPQLKQKGRARKTAIVALARQLLVALYRYIMYGEEIKGAKIDNKAIEKAMNKAA